MKIDKSIAFNKKKPLSFLAYIREVLENNLPLTKEEMNYIENYASCTKKIPKNEIKNEFIKILSDLDKPSGYFEILKNLQVLHHILPELNECDGVITNQDFHNKDVFKHTMEVLDYFPPEKNIELRLAALFHDLGKPLTQNNPASFYRHELESARITKDVMERFGFEPQITQNVVQLVKYHMTIFSDINEIGLRKLWEYMGRDNLLKLLELKESDLKSLKISLDHEFEALLWTKEKIKEIGENNQIINKSELVITEQDLKSFGIKSDTGYILDCLFEGVVFGTFKNEKKELLEKAHKIAEHFPK